MTGDSAKVERRSWPTRIRSTKSGVSVGCNVSVMRCSTAAGNDPVPYLRRGTWLLGRRRPSHAICFLRPPAQKAPPPARSPAKAFERAKHFGQRDHDETQPGRDSSQIGAASRQHGCCDHSDDISPHLHAAERSGDTSPVCHSRPAATFEIMTADCAVIDARSAGSTHRRNSGRAVKSVVTMGTYASIRKAECAHVENPMLGLSGRKNDSALLTRYTINSAVRNFGAYRIRSSGLCSVQRDTS